MRHCAFVFVVMFAFTILAAAAQDRGLQVVAASVAGTDLQVGKQYAVLIGIDRYAEWGSLRNPVKDVKAIKEILARRYYVDEFVELYDEAATAAGIRRLFDDLIARVGPTDSVLIYYAGHGYTDKYNTGFWIPSDGSKDLMSQDRWIGNSQIRNFMTMIKARSLALVSDSCFSGDLINVQRGATPTIDSEYWRNALRYTAKQVLTSGASETVPDESEFARQFKSLLESNTETCLDPLAMYDRIRRGVTKTLPLLGTLPGHESGASFVLFLKGSGGAATVIGSSEIQPKQTPLAGENLEEAGFVEKEVFSVRPAKTRLITLYFVRIDDDGVIVRQEVSRAIPESDTPLFDALVALLRGPVEPEIRKNLVSIIPSGTKLLSVRMQGTTAVINLGEAFLYNHYGIEGYAGQLKQVVYTATSFPNVHDVQILIDGERHDYLGGEGIYIGRPLSRNSF